MPLIDYFQGRSNARQVRSGVSIGHSNAKLRERDKAGSSHAFSGDTIGPLGIFFCLVLVAAAVYVLDYGVLPPLYHEKEIPAGSIRARQDFDHYDPDEITNLRKIAAERAPHVYIEDGDWVDKILRDLSELIGIVEVAKSASDARERAARFPQDANLVVELFNYNDSVGNRQRFLRDVLLDRIHFSLKTIAGNGVLKEDDLDIERNKQGDPREIIRITAGQIENAQPASEPQSASQRRLVRVEKLSNIRSAIEELRQAAWREGVPPDLERLLFQHLYTRLNNNLQLDPKQSKDEMEKAQATVGSGAVRIRQNEIIISPDQPISRAGLDRLHEEYRAYKRSLSTEARLRHLGGLATMAAALLIAFLCVAGRIHENIFQRRRGLLMLGLLVLAALVAIRACLLVGVSLALAPFVFVAMVASLAFGQTVAVLTMLGLGILSVFAAIRWEAFPMEGGMPALSLALMAGGIAAALPAANLRGRWDLLKYAVFGGLVQGGLMAGLSQLGGGWSTSAIPDSLLTHGWAGVPALGDSLLALGMGPLSGLLVLGSLPLIETLFGMLTNIRLFELADVNQPAIQHIMQEAQGTFAHTLQVRFLAEAASEAIGANTRLVSAGVMYHDLGKTLKPEYFVENQMDAEARHRRLRPSVSALLITAHVKDGVELAREYGLPSQIIDFIPEHHGTTLVSYFFDSAKKNAESQAHSPGMLNTGGAETVQEAFFRYPGPKPQSRETAIVMLADTIEAASRTLESPSAARLSVFVHELIMAKMLDGQLDECNLTFADLARCEHAFLRVLVTRFHSRIRYPHQRERKSDHEHEEAEHAANEKTTTVVDVLPADADTATRRPPTPTPVAASISRREVLTETRFLGHRPSSANNEDLGASKPGTEGKRKN